MRLTKLELNGFKSFADPTQMIFEPGVTAIVGPNGCGKSNVSDAVRWVLGEQRARLLRGAKMEEVIFQGSSARRQVNVADVSLHFENDDGTLPVAFREVVITRRLSRSGESEYLLNGSSCRLRDIHDLMRGTGLGADAGVVIEARMIDALLSDRPDDRRELFEEAAGVGLYRDRRRSTERRLEETNLDISRVDDLIGEVQSQVRSLARQRGKAERHAKLNARRFIVEIALAAREMAAWKEELATLEDRVVVLRTESPDASASEHGAERERDERYTARSTAESHRGELARLESSLRESLLHLQSEIAVAEERQRNSRSRRERAEGERREGEAYGGRLSNERDQAVTDRVRLQRELSRAGEELHRMGSAEDVQRESVAAARAALELVEEEARQARANMHRVELEREGANREVTELAARMQSLAAEKEQLAHSAAESRRERAAAKDGLQEAHEKARKAGAELESARAAAGKSKDKESDARATLFRADEALAALEGRVSALESLERERVGLAPAAAALLKERADFGDGAILGPISDFIMASAESALDVESFLGPMVHAVLVRDAAATEAIRQWHQKKSPGPLVLLPLDSAPVADGPTLVGTLGARVSATDSAQRWVKALLGSVRGAQGGDAFVDDRGAVWLPGAPGGPGPLRRRAELTSLREQLAHASRTRQVAVEAANVAHTEATRCESADSVCTQAASEAARALRTAEERLVDSSRRGDRIERELADIEAQVERSLVVQGALVEREREMSETITVVADLEASLSHRISSERDALATSQRALDESREARSTRQIEVAQLDARLQVATDRERRLEEEMSAASVRISSLLHELNDLSTDDARLAEQMADWQLQIDSRHASLHDAQSRLAAGEQAVVNADAALSAAEHNLDRLRRRTIELGDELHQSELRLTDLQGRRSAIRERLEAEWRRPLQEMLATCEQPDIGDEELRAETMALREQLEQLGPVNPFAIEEHAEETKRVEFLIAQRADLADARGSLQLAIKEIDSTARELFMETFSRVRENFRQIFMTLFGGGECDIKLENPEAPLDCDIEIHASPRGKRTQRIHLLSSGERALVALSLLFGIFLTKPSPFCLLDEVDAPLDDQNIGRFVHMLNEFKDKTQFIVITHNPRTTTEAADAVYGVTMQEPGVSSLVSVRMDGQARENEAA